MKELLIEKKPLVITVAVIILLFVLLTVIDTISKGTTAHKKINSEDYVYTLKSTQNEKGVESKLPIINLDFEDIAEYNDSVQELYHKITADKKNTFAYEYTLDKNILYLLIRIDFDDITNHTMNTRFVSFNFDLKTGEILENKDVLSKYGFTIANVSNSITNKMKNYYKDSNKKGYLDTYNCTFSDYLLNHDFDPNNMAGNVSLFIKDKKLVLYRGFTIDTVLGDKDYFVREDFIFPLEK
ncbi:MAG: hypothetical protein PHN72_05155 [Bacilli bacterium]|nr:hypothetical protein [Bacilli bacterium]